MSISKEIAHELRPVASTTAQSVLPSWAKIIPIAFFAGLVYFLSMWAYHNFRINIYDAQKAELSKAAASAQMMLSQDQRTVERLQKLHNTVVTVARWVDYNPMIQPMIKGVFLPIKDDFRVVSLRLLRSKAVVPEYTMEFVFRTPQERADSVVGAVRNSLETFSWNQTINSQTYQEGSTELQAIVSPLTSVRFESLGIARIQAEGEFEPEPTGVAY